MHRATDVYFSGDVGGRGDVYIVMRVAGLACCGN